MKFISTRNEENSVNFEKAVLDCLPSDGGLYVPEDSDDLRKWILYTNEKTTFSSISGALTSAFINEEFSPIICESIATNAFTFEPRLNKIDEKLFTLELFHTPTGSHKDFGISYLINSLEAILTLKETDAIFLDATLGELGASVAKTIRGKKRMKAVLLYPTKPCRMIRGLEEEDFIWNGGNVLPVEIDGTEADCHQIVREIFADRKLVEKFHLTMANTTNIGRLIPQSFFYPFAFSRLKNQICGDIFYAMAPGNYSNLVAGLYSWKLALPVNGFICPTTNELQVDPQGNCEIMDSIVDVHDRKPCDPASPSNLERLEYVFNANSLMLKHFIYPSEVSERETTEACQELFMKYKIFADKPTSQAYAAAKKRAEMTEEDEAAVVLVMRDHPAMSIDFIRHTIGEAPEMPESVRNAFKPTSLNRPTAKTPAEIVEMLQTI
jgi:threonine synthase